MKTLNVRLWWSFGKGDGDGYYDSVEIDDETYRILAEINPEDDIELDEIDDPRIAAQMQELHEKLIDQVVQNSVEAADWELYEEECRIYKDDDDDEIEKDEESDEDEDAEYTMDIEEWVRNSCVFGCRLNHDFSKEQ